MTTLTAPEAEKATEETTGLTTEVAEPVEENVIVYLLHESDKPLFNELLTHINNLALRFGNLFTWKGYEFPTYKTEKHAYEQFVKSLEHSFLFIPLTSPQFLSSFWRLLDKNALLKRLLASTYVQPIPLHLTHGVAQTLLPKPLAAYEGYEREEACAAIIAFLETKMLAHLAQSQQSEPTLLPMLAETRHDEETSAEATQGQPEENTKRRFWFGGK